MNWPEVVQGASAFVSAAVVVNELLKQIREWRGGSPELRTLNRTIDRIQDEQIAVLRDIASRVP